MDVKEYKEKVNRTIAHSQSKESLIQHYLLGIMTEIGELLDVYKKNVYYSHTHLAGSPWTNCTELSKQNIKEELGDLLWYINAYCIVAGIDIQEAMSDNIAKLLKRYPEKFTYADAVERKDKEDTP